MYSFYAKTIYYLNEPLYHYFVRKNSIMDNYFSGNPKNSKDRISITNTIFDFLKQKKLLNRYKYDILDIYKTQLNQAMIFFTNGEKRKIIDEINSKLKKELSTQTKILLARSGKIVVIYGTFDVIKIFLKFYLYTGLNLFFRNFKKNKLQNLIDYCSQLKK